MCTLIVYYHLHEAYPLIVAANRDEQRNRIALPPHPIMHGNVVIYAGRDMQGEGTWLGINTHGLLVGITNRRSARPLDSNRRSRGLLCLDALALSSACAVYRLIKSLEVAEYNPFNLFYADDKRAFVTHYDEKPDTRELPRGLYVLASKDINDFTFPRLKQVYQLAEKVPLDAPLGQITGQLQAICRHHAGGTASLESICVHNGTYGTVSSTIMALPRGTLPPCYLYAPGSPCLASYQDYTSDFPFAAQGVSCKGGAAEKPCKP
jgi:hypothetical protein